MVAHTFNPNTQEAEAGDSPVNLKPAWSMLQIPGQPGLLHRETLSWKNKQVSKQTNKEFDGGKFILLTVSEVLAHPCLRDW